MVYYDLHVHSDICEGESKTEELALRVKEFGWHGICLVERIHAGDKLKINQEELREISEKIGIHIFHGVEIIPENVKELKKILKSVREKALVVTVHGGNYEINRAACEDSRVDILSHPELDRNDNGLDEYCLKKARENEVCIELSFRHILHSHGVHRVRMLQNIAENIRLCSELGVNMILTSDAKSIWDIRDPRALASFANVLGMELGKAIKCVSEIPEYLINKNSEILSGKKPVKGVEVVEDEG